MGKLAWSHCESDRVLLVICESAVLSRLSKFSGPCASTEGEQRSKCQTLGALNDAHRRISACWWPTRQSLSTALERSRPQSNQKSFKTLPLVVYDPEGWQKIDRRQNTTKLAGMICHLVNKALMKQNCIEALNQHAQSLEQKAAFLSFTWNLGNPSTKTTEKRDSWTVNRVITFQRSVVSCLASCCKLSYSACILRCRMDVWFCQLWYPISGFVRLPWN